MWSVCVINEYPERMFGWLLYMCQVVREGEKQAKEVHELREHEAVRIDLIVENTAGTTYHIYVIFLWVLIMICAASAAKSAVCSL